MKRRNFLVSIPAGCLVGGGFFSLLTGCGEKDSGRRRSSSSDEDEAAPEANIVVVSLMEMHRDDFPEVLDGSWSTEEEEPFWLTESRVALTGEVAGAVEKDRLEKYHLTLGDASVPLERCQLLVTRSRIYVGVGREGEQADFFAFPDRKGAVKIEAGISGDEYVMDYAADGLPPAMALAAVRVNPELDVEFAVTEGEGGRKLEVRCNGKEHVLAAGEKVELHSAQRKVRVTEKEMVAEFEEAGAKFDETLFPAIDHGMRTFITTVVVRFEGVFAADFKAGAEPVGKPNEEDDAL